LAVDIDATIFIAFISPLAASFTFLHFIAALFSLRVCLRATPMPHD